jgi:hypothetical protein
MKISGSRQQLCMGGWFLAALVLLGLNVSRFVSLEHQPLVGYSQTVKTLHSGLQDFDKMVATGVFSLKNQVNLLEAGPWFSAGSTAEANPGDVKAKSGSQIADAAEILLPTLTGILQALDPRGTIDYRAVLNGRVCRVKDKIDEFTVVKISPAGVIVRRAGRSWRLDSPTPYYSSDQGS